MVEDRIIPLAGMGGEPLSAGTVRFLRLCDGERELGYALREVIDLVAIEGEVIAAEAPGEIAGVALIGGEQAEVIDPHWLFASLTGQAAQVVQRVCRIPSNDPWMQSFLRPLVEAAGYRVVDEADAAKADLAIAASDDTGPRLEGAEVIRLRASPDEQTDGEGSIYRYDRAELMFALKATSARKAS